MPFQGEDPMLFPKKPSRVATAVLSAGLAALFFYSTGCTKAPVGDDSKMVAKVNGVPITTNDVSFRLREAHGRTPQYGQGTLDDTIDQELLSQKAVQLGLDRDPSYRAILPKLRKEPAGARRLELARRVFNTQIASTVDVRHQEGEEYYRRNAGKIATELHLELIRTQQ